MALRRDLLDVRMADGSRHFAEVPWRPPVELRRRMLDTPGFTVTAFIDSGIETWVDFEYGGTPLAPTTR